MLHGGVCWWDVFLCVSCFTVLFFDLDGFRFIISKGSKIRRATRRFTSMALLASFQGGQHFFILDAAVDAVMLR